MSWNDKNPNLTEEESLNRLKAERDLNGPNWIWRDPSLLRLQGFFRVLLDWLLPTMTDQAALAV